MGDSRAPTVAALTCSLCSTTARGSTCRKLQWSRSCCAFFWWPTSLLCRSCWCRFLRLWAPCDHAATSFLFNSGGAQIRSSPEFMHIYILLFNREGHSTSAVPVMTAMQGFWRILRHFLRSSVYPGVERRQFFELSSAHTCECSRAPGVPESPGVTHPGDSAPGLLPIHAPMSLIKTHC